MYIGILTVRALDSNLIGKRKGWWAKDWNAILCDITQKAYSPFLCILFLYLRKLDTTWNIFLFLLLFTQCKRHVDMQSKNLAFAFVILTAADCNVAKTTAFCLVSQVDWFFESSSELGMNLTWDSQSHLLCSNLFFWKSLEALGFSWVIQKALP